MSQTQTTKLPTKPKEVPKITDLVNIEDAFKNDQFKVLLNQNPPEKWVLQNKFANNSLYVPIDKIEYLLDVLFQNWKVEVLDYKPIFNSISVSVRLHYINPITGEWQFHDGVGAKELQTKAESGVLKPDFSNVGKSAIEMALPIAKTNAIKDAADHLGKIFGRDLNRKSAIEYASPYQNLTPTNRSKADEVNNILTFINAAKSLEELNEVEIAIEKLNDNTITLIFQNKIKELQ